MKHFNSILIILSLLLLARESFAQDVIYRINPRQEINCKVLEVGDEKVRYMTTEFSDSLMFNIDVRNVQKIVFSSGRILTPHTSLNDDEPYESQLKDAFKFSFLSPLRGYLGLGFEHSLHPGQSLDFGLGFIGIGWDNSERKPIGLSLRAGSKFIISPDFESGRQLYSHILKGWYVEPEVCLVGYRSDITQYDASGNVLPDKTRATTLFAGFSILGGKQWIFANRFLVDLNLGFGYAFGEFGDTSSTYNYGYSVYSSSSPLSATVGFKIGYLF